MPGVANRKTKVHGQTGFGGSPIKKPGAATLSRAGGAQLASQRATTGKRRDINNLSSEEQDRFAAALRCVARGCGDKQTAQAVAAMSRGDMRMLASDRASVRSVLYLRPEQPGW